MLLDGEKFLDAAERGEVHKVRHFLDQGMNIEYKRKMNGQNALMMASLRGQFDSAKLLIDQKIKLDSKNKYGRTALHIAADKGHLRIVEALIQAGANINILDNKKHKPDDYASMGGHVECREALRRAMSNIQRANTIPARVPRSIVTDPGYRHRVAENIRSQQAQEEVHLAVRVPSERGLPVAEVVEDQRMIDVPNMELQNNEVNSWFLDHDLGFLVHPAQYHELNSFQLTRLLNEEELFRMLCIKSQDHKQLLRDSPLMQDQDASLS